jgi:hypothetical protein
MQKRTKDVLILVIGLIALSVAVYVSFRRPAAPPGAAAEKKPATRTIVKAPAPTPALVPAPGTPPTDVKPPAPEGAGPGAPARNPFSSPLPEAGGPAGPASPVVTPSNGAAPGTAPPSAPGAAPGAAPVPTPVPTPAPTFTLSGFSRYNGRTMATLRAGERHLYVYEGDSVGEGYRVSSISPAKGQVVLAKTGQQPIVLTREGGK